MYTKLHLGNCSDILGTAISETTEVLSIWDAKLTITQFLLNSPTWSITIRTDTCTVPADVRKYGRTPLNKCEIAVLYIVWCQNPDLKKLYKTLNFNAPNETINRQLKYLNAQKRQLEMTISLAVDDFRKFVP